MSFYRGTGTPGTGTASSRPVRTDELAASTGSSMVGFIQSGTGAVATTVQEKERERISNLDYGAIADGSSHPLSERFGSLAAAQLIYPHAVALTDEIDWAAGQAAINQAYAAGKGAWFFGHSRTNRTLGINATLPANGNRPFPSIFGEQASGGEPFGGSLIKGSIIQYTGTGKAVEFSNNGSIATFFFGGKIKDITIYKTYNGGFYPTDGSTGLKLEGCCNYRLDNVSVLGFDRGFHNDYGWSWTTFGLISMGNNIGVLLSDNSNALSMFGNQVHQNNVNVKITGGENINIHGVVSEGANSIPLVISSDNTLPAPSRIFVSGIYTEACPQGMPIGKDENGVTSPLQINQVTIRNATLNMPNPPTEPVLDLDYVDGVFISGFDWGFTQSFMSSTSLTKNVRFDDAKMSYVSHSADRYARGRRLVNSNPQNLAVNGLITLPDISDFKRGGLTAALDSATYTGETVVKITIPTGTVNNYLQGKYIKITPEMAGTRLVLSATAQADSGFTASFIAYNSAFGGISGGSFSFPTAGLETKNASFVVPSGHEWIFVAMSFTNNSGVDKFAYIKTIVVRDAAASAENLTPGPLDYISGLSGTVSATAAGIAVTLTGWANGMYRVLLTPRSNVTTWAVYASGSFTIYSSANATVDYLIIPVAGILQ